MDFGGISLGVKSLLIAIVGNLTAVRYRDEFLTSDPWLRSLYSMIMQNPTYPELVVAFWLTIAISHSTGHHTVQVCPRLEHLYDVLRRRARSQRDIPKTQLRNALLEELI